MAWAHVQSVPYTESGTAGTSHQLTGVTTTAGNLLLVAIAVHGVVGSVASVTDGAGNTYRRLPSGAQSSTTAAVEIWATSGSSPAALSSSTVTVTTKTAMGVAFRVWEFSGGLKPISSPFLTPASGSSTSAASSATAASLFTTDLCLAAVATDGTATASSSSFTAGAATSTQTDSSTTTASAVQLISAYRIMTAVTAQTYSVTLGTSRAWAATMARAYVAGNTVSAVCSLNPQPTATKTTGAVQAAATIVSDYVGQFI